MARRREQVARPDDDADLILPRELVEFIPYDCRANAERLDAQHRARSQWLAEHGIGHRDFNLRSHIVHASEAAHGIEDSRHLFVDELGDKD